MTIFNGLLDWISDYPDKDTVIMESKEEKIQRCLKDFRMDERIEENLAIFELKYGEFFNNNHITHSDVRDILLKRIDGITFDWSSFGVIVPKNPTIPV